MERFKIIVAVVLMILLLILGVQNSGVVTVRFLGWQGEISLVALVGLTALAGFLIGFLLFRLGVRKRSRSGPVEPPRPPAA